MTTTPRSTLVGLIGHGIARSLSPALHEQEARHQGLALTYRRIDLQELRLGIEALPALLSEARAAGYAGVNITHPCKQAVIAFLDELSPQAAAIGAVNTVVFRDDRMIGYNTDCSGFAAALRLRMPARALGHVVLLGAGGAGAAVAHAALQLGAASLTLIDRDANKAEALAAALRQHFSQRRIECAGEIAAAMGKADGLIHATPTGMHGHAGMALPAHLLAPHMWVAELVYFPLETDLVRTARARGCTVIDGGGMAVWQAAGAFELFTGRTADTARMQAHFDRLVVLE